MKNFAVLVRISDHLTSRRGAWISLAVVLLAFFALFAVFGRAGAPPENASAPADAESARVNQVLAGFPDADEQTVLVVASRNDAQDLSASDVAALQALLPMLDGQTGLSSTGPMVSDDGAAAAIITPVTVGADNAATAEIVKELRAAVASNSPADLRLHITGGPAFGADVTAAFDGADFTLLAVTLLIVAVLLIVTYRSPILWLFPLAVVAFADQLAGKMASSVGATLGLQFDTGIISVLVFGAGTNYALLLISRYREELLVRADHRAAMSEAWRKTVPAIVASNVTVVLSLLTLMLAVTPGTRGLGVTSAVGLLIALGAVLFALPPLLAIGGRKVFWPFIPRPGSGARDGRVWHAVASRVMRRPLVSLVAGLAVLMVMAGGLIDASVGLSQVEKFRVQSESVVGLEVLAAHFPPGESQPILIVAAAPAAGRVVDAVDGVDGVVRAHITGVTADGATSRVMVTGQYAPGTAESLDLVTRLRNVVHAVPGAEALVGGAVATDLDARASNQRDLLLIVPLVLAVSFVVLLVLLGSVVAPLLLLAVNLASALAAIGAGAWLSRIVLDQPALDLQVPLLSFLFLVALGIDYTVFLVHRARTEADVHGTREGMVQAVTHTGGVITSAGIVLAAVFAALGVLPLVTLGQLGLIVGLGVIVDTLLVRTVIVPSLFGAMGDRIWWPRTAPVQHGRVMREDHASVAGTS